MLMPNGKSLDPISKRSLTSGETQSSDRKKIVQVLLLFIIWQVFLSSPSTKIEHFDWFLSGRKPTVRTAQV